MNWFSRLERLSSKFIEGIFRTKFPGPLQPVDIARTLVREMGDRRFVGVNNVYVPNHFEIRVSQEDWAELELVQTNIVQEITDYLRTKAEQRGYILVQEPQLEFAVEEGIPRGEFRVEAKFTHRIAGTPIEEPIREFAEPQLPAEPLMLQEHEELAEKEQTRVFSLGNLVLPDEPAGKKPGAELRVTSGELAGMKYRLGRTISVVGRRENNEVFLDDPNISRVHAQIEFLDGAYQLSDLGSLNGTYVNDKRVSKATLQSGDQIRIGKTELEFRVV